MNSFFSEYWSDLSQIFANSQQRLFYGYLLCALVIAFIWLAKTTSLNLRSNLISALGLKQWRSRSAFADYKIIIINKAIFLFIVPLLITKLTIATAMFELMHQAFSQRIHLSNDIPRGAIIAAFTLFIFVLDDFARFYLHKLMHQIPWLWQFHNTHHSATSLTPLTVLRTHPVEGLLFALRSAVVQGLSIAVFIFFFADKVDLYTALKVNVLVFAFNIAGSNLRHSHIAIHYWRWLENILISPAQHQIHHSVEPRHFNKNYGATIALWDKLANSHCYSEPQHPLNFGLNKKQSASEHSLYNLYLAPFLYIFISSKKMVYQKLIAIKLGVLNKAVHRSEQAKCTTSDKNHR